MTGESIYKYECGNLTSEAYIGLFCKATFYSHGLCIKVDDRELSTEFMSLGNLIIWSDKWHDKCGHQEVQCLYLSAYITLLWFPGKGKFYLI